MMSLFPVGSYEHGRDFGTRWFYYSGRKTNHRLVVEVVVTSTISWDATSRISNKLMVGTNVYTKSNI